MFDIGTRLAEMNVPVAGKGGLAGVALTRRFGGMRHAIQFSRRPRDLASEIVPDQRQTLAVGALPARVDAPVRRAGIVDPRRHDEGTGRSASVKATGKSLD